jgi:tyrosine-specific transport protein
MKSPLLGAIGIIVGTTIGVGTLALPVTLSAYGLFPTIALILAAWLIMTVAALLLLEVNLWMPRETNLVSMARRTLGRSGQWVAWSMFLGLFYALVAAYVIGVGDLLSNSLNHYVNQPFSAFTYAFIFFAVIGLLIYCGVIYIDGLNRVLMLGLLTTFFLLNFSLFPYIDKSLLLASHSPYALIALPVVIIGFGFHNVIPSMRDYLNNDVRKIRQAIIYGSLGILAINLLWTFAILSVVPYDGDAGLLHIIESEGDKLTNLAIGLQQNHGVNAVYVGMQYFAFFAITTSVIGVSLSLFDFLADGLAIKKSMLGKITLLALTFGPPFLLALYYTRFIGMLEYGAIFAAVLFIGLPAMMTLLGRKQYSSAGYRVAGGQVTSLITLLAGAVIISIALLQKYIL